MATTGSGRHGRPRPAPRRRSRRGWYLAAGTGAALALVTWAFVSAGGVHPKLGVSCANFSEVAMKRAVIENAAESYLVIDSSKLDKVKAAHFADCSDFTAILSERGRVPIGAKKVGV